MEIAATYFLIDSKMANTGSKKIDGANVKGRGEEGSDGKGKGRRSAAKSVRCRRG